MSVGGGWVRGGSTRHPCFNPESLSWLRGRIDVMGSSDVVDPEYGRLLNTVVHHAECPVHEREMSMQVFENGVRWACGHSRPLPPLKFGRGADVGRVPVRIVGRAA